MPRQADCHPERTHYAKGLCRPCYMGPYQKIYRDENRERVNAESRERGRRWRERDPARARELGRAADKRFYERHGQRRVALHPERHAARQAVNSAVRDGRLLRQPCHRCGKTPSFGHHFEGYDRAHWLDVEWLCLGHHLQAHRQAA